MKIAVCDNETIYADMIGKYLMDIVGKNGYDATTDVYEDPVLL